MHPAPTEAQWRALYADDVHFQDPTQERQGIAAYLAAQEGLIRRCDDTYLTPGAIAVDGDTDRVLARAQPWRLDAVPDRPPEIRVRTPEVTLSTYTRGLRSWPLVFEASDDHGVAADAGAVEFRQAADGHQRVGCGDGGEGVGVHHFPPASGVPKRPTWPAARLVPQKSVSEQTNIRPP